MAVRHVTLRLDSLPAFMEAWEGTLSQHMLVVGPEALDGDELAPNFKADLVLPIGGRVGPIEAQVVQPLPGGGAAARFEALPPQVERRIRRILAFVEEVRAWLASREPAPRPGQGVPEEAPGARHGVREEKPPAAAAPARDEGPSVRGIPIPDLSQVPPDRSGDLADRRGFIDALLALEAERAQGLLTLELPDGRRRWGCWQRGGAVAWRTEPVQPAEVLGALLFHGGLLDEAAVQASLERMEERGIRQGEALVDLGHLTYAQLVLALSKQAEVVTRQALSEERGRWTFHALERLPERFLAQPQRVSAILYRDLRDRFRELPAVELYGRLQRYMNLYVYLSERLELLERDIRWSAKEVAFLEVVRQRSWRLRELFQVSHFSRVQTAAVVLALLEMGLVEFREEESRETWLDRVARRITTKARSLGKATHFDVLEIHWICLDDEVENAYRRLTGEFAPERHPGLPPDLDRSLRAIRRRIEEAYQVIRDPLRRRAYREEVIEAPMITHSAELLARKGEMAIMKRDSAEAINCWAKAVELQPGRPEYRDGLQRAQAVRA